MVFDLCLPLEVSPGVVVALVVGVGGVAESL